jgi:hypothetical protein
VLFFLVHLLLLRLVRLVAGRSAAAALEPENAVLRYPLAASDLHAVDWRRVWVGFHS